jgi:hypothetical protein
LKVVALVVISIPLCLLFEPRLSNIERTQAAGRCATASGDVPPTEPYLPWDEDEERGYVSRKKVREFVEAIRESSSGAASAEAIEEALLRD